MSFFWPSFVFGTRFSDILNGSSRSDFIFGFGGGDVIRAGAGADRISAGSGDDEIDAGTGNDWVLAGSGDDVIVTGAGNDTVFGGRGFDTVSYEGGIGDYTITTGRGRVTVTSSLSEDAGTDTLRQVEALYFKADDYTLFLDGANNAVLAADDSASTDEGMILTLGVADLLANDQEFDGDLMTITSVDAVSASGAAVSLAGGTVTYTPGDLFDALQAGDTATDSFTYTVDDGKGGTDTATVTVTINGVNTGPVLSADAAVTIDENTVLVPANVTASDVDSALVTFSLGGTDAALFGIDASTGAITFLTAPDFETPADANADNAYELDIIASDGDGGTASSALTVTVADVDEVPPVDARINEFHYDNVGGDTGEFIEIRTAAGDDVSFLTVELVNGSGGAVYDSESVAAMTMTTDGTYDYYVWSLPSNGLQNGTPDGIVLANGGEVIEFLSYEGSFEATNGAAAGLTSTDIGVMENAVDLGLSLQREEDGTWGEARAETSGGANILPVAQIVISEVMQNPSAVSDADGEWFELFNAGDSTVDLNGWTVSDNDSDSFVIDNGGPLLIAPGAYLVLGNNGDTATNGGVAVDYAYSGMFLSNGADELVLTDTLAREVDRIEWDGGTAWPDPNGASMALIDTGAENNDGANWTTSDTAYGDGDLGTPGAENAAPAEPPVLVISEVMQNPAAVSDSDGEWFEIYNPGSDDIDINGWTISDNDSDSHTIDNGGPLIVPAGGYLVLGNNADTATNGGVPVAYAYGSGFFLSNGADELVLTDPATGEVDRIEWDGGTAWPDPNGASMALIDPSADNNDGANWTTADTPYGDGDLGTPGVENFDTTPVIVINEIMQNPSAVADGSGEWFEVYNAGTTVVDMNGWTVSDNDSDSFVIDNGGPLLVAPGDYLVFANNGDMATNGGVTVDYAYSGMFLSNSADELVLTAGDGTEIDRVEYDGGPAFPDPTGASMALISADLDNNDGANWETATDSYGDGDLGTPGAANGDSGGGGGGTAEELLISQVQGTGSASPYETMDVTVNAIVTYTVSDGFFLQEEDADADGDASTSEGIFVFTGSGGTLPSLGDQVSVTGTVTEYFGETQMTSVSDVTIVSGGNPMPTPAQLLLGPDATAADKEAIEGMYFDLLSGTTDPITIITNFNFDRFGEIIVSAGVQYQPTQLFDAQTETAEVLALMEDNANNTLKIDDGLSAQNPTEFAYIANTSAGDNGNGILDAGDVFTADGPTVRLGTEFASTASGVMTYDFGAYTMLVDGTLPLDSATNEGARDAVPDAVGGTLQVGAFNVLNYFTTLDDGSGTVGPNGLDPRGATTASDFDRQEAKIVNAMAASGIDVFALQEIENNGFGADSASQALADALSTETGESFAVVDPTGGAAYLGTDAISTSIIYDSNKVTLVDSASIVFAETSAADTFAKVDLLTDLTGAGSIGDFQRNRPAVIATFEDNLTGEQFTVASVHFKSKGDSGLQSALDTAEAYLSANAATLSAAEVAEIEAAILDLATDANFDQGNGQAFWNGVRTDAADELYSFLSNEYGGSGVDNYVILGDFNAYTQEDPTQAISEQADTVDLLAEYVGEDAYSFVFDGQRGALDQVIADNGFAENVTGLTEWHINADEPDLLNYSSTFNDERFYSDDLFASSDHDPVIIGLDFFDPVDTILV
ncbi:ExeM/NucH family extracellular endonuclease [Aliishimia ponticola]|uniref:ExeM/NucH family extracellular endonuclease n=1 Tax=Aliishimia ponticola TaxID=2499833 RepID=A0A4S4NJE8_9RHOB|nr:ExeM/NucH family extracellular endonuclease [Aliishimia ponticola]THH38371.1 ExeM/NucH family extracellular endonuclease [Aliishimia ponticola]